MVNIERFMALSFHARQTHGNNNNRGGWKSISAKDSVVTTSQALLKYFSWLFRQSSCFEMAWVLQINSETDYKNIYKLSTVFCLEYTLLTYSTNIIHPVLFLKIYGCSFAVEGAIFALDICEILWVKTLFLSRYDEKRLLVVIW